MNVNCQRDQRTGVLKSILTSVIRQMLSWPSAEYHDTFFAYDNGQVALQFDNNSIYSSGVATDLSHCYVWNPQAVDQLFADKQVSWNGSSFTGETLWAITDREGSVHDLVDSNGKIRLHRDFDAFGAGGCGAASGRAAGGAPGVLSLLVAVAGRMAGATSD